MSFNLVHHVDNIKGLYIDRKMLGILLVFAFLGILLLSILILATNSLSGLRAYSNMQVYWIDARKDGTTSLIRFLDTGEVHHLYEFDQSMELIRNAREVRLELMNDDPDYPTVREKLLAIHTHPRDVQSMIKTFERFHTLEHFSDAVRLWDESEAMTQQFEVIAEELIDLLESGELNDIHRSAYLDRIQMLTDQLSEHKHVVSAGLSGGTRLLQNIIIWLSVSLFGILMLSGFILSYRFLKRIKKWGEILEASEQRYKSLFERNPNAVFSLDKNGFFESGNEVFERISGLTKEELAVKNISHFAVPEEVDNIKDKLVKVFDGNPQSFETRWRNSIGVEIPLQITILPIYVNGNIEGAFSIAEDISFHKYAEKKIKMQLEEKTFLLGEVHDRVKNNLALMSSMLQLQESYINDKQAKEYLDITISRIRSMAMVHEKLYQTDSFASIRIDDFINGLSDSIIKTHRSKYPGFNIEVNTVPLMMGIKKAIPFGLLINELLSNAIKHSLQKNDNGKIEVTLVKTDDQVEFMVRDSLSPLQADSDSELEPSLGMTLITTLAKQLNGELEFSNGDGRKVRLTLAYVYREPHGKSTSEMKF